VTSTRLKSLREDHDYTQERLAKYLHISQSTYSAYENGKINMPYDILIKLGDFYNTSLDYIMKRTNNSKPY